MDSNTVLKQCTSEMTYCNCRDRISELPDDILYNILSVLPSIRDVMNTSILSKRWGRLWPSVSSLCFRDIDFDDVMKFKLFVDSFIIRRGVFDVHTFDLSLQGYFIDNENLYQSITRWIEYAIKSNVNVLRVDVWDADGMIDFPGINITCGSLVELCLQHRSLRYFSRAPKLSSLCQLKRLHLGGFIFDGDLEMTSICPLLQDLCLELCTFMNLDISSQTIMKLKIESCDGMRLRIFCPNLTSFQYTGIDEIIYFRKTELDGLSSLDNVLIESSTMLDGDSYRGLSYAKSLALSDIHYVFKSEEIFSHFRIFFNLKSLNIGGYRLRMDRPFRRRLSLFLQFTPYLEILTLGIKYCDEEETSWELTEPSFECQRLNDVKIMYNECRSPYP